MLSYRVFDNVSELHAEEVVGPASPRAVKAGEFVLREGELNDRLFLIDSGALTVLKATWGSGDVEVAKLGPGDCFGEMSVLAGIAASASLRADSDSVVRSIRLSEILDPSIRSNVVVNIGHILATRLSAANDLIGQTHELKLKSMRRQLAAADALTKSMTMLSIYMLMEPFAARVNGLLGSTTAFSTLEILMFFAATFAFMRTSGVSLGAYGMSLDGLAEKLRIGVVWSLPFVVILVAIKFLGSLIAPGLIHVIEPDNRERLVGAETWTAYFAILCLYVVLTFAQEFIRCSVQSSLDLFRASEDAFKRGLGAMLVADVVFAALHIHLGPMYALGAFITGLFWGWMYTRTGSYWASAFSHVLVGAIGIFLLGVPDLSKASAPAAGAFSVPFARPQDAPGH